MTDEEFQEVYNAQEQFEAQSTVEHDRVAVISDAKMVHIEAEDGRKSRPNRPKKYPFDTTLVGESFAVFAKPFRVVYAAVAAHNKSHPDGPSFKVYKVADLSPWLGVEFDGLAGSVVERVK